MKLGIWLLGAVLLGASCSQESVPDYKSAGTGELPVGTPVNVTADLRVSVCPITPVVAPATRGEGSADSDDDSQSLRVNYVQPDATRSDMSAAEKEIKTAYVVQFNGTSSTSTAVSVSGDVAAQLKNGLPASHNFTLTSGVKNRVYVVANPKTTPTTGMTLQNLEVVAYTVTAALPATGLPMAAYQDVALGETFNLFQLRSPLTRLTFTTNVGTLSLKGIPSAYSLVPATAGSGAVRPSGVTYTATVALTSGTAYYVPANLSGRVDLPKHIFRYSAFAPANSMFVEVSANSTTYNIYLGDGSVSDFNVLGNTAYNITAFIYGANTSDLRVGTPTITALDGSGTANCYIATSTFAWYSFNATVMGNGKSTPLPGNLASGSVAAAITPTALTPVSADVLWETWNTTSTPSKGSVVQHAFVINNRIWFCTSGWQGNAVIAARDASNNIIWSWHIWRTNTTPATQTLANIVSTSGNFDATGTTTLSGLQIMDRNLGALSAAPQNNLSTGLHYQWGRKDPIPAYAGLTSPDNVDMATRPADIPIYSFGGASIAQLIAQPTTFFVGGINRNDNAWGTPLTGTVTINNGSAKTYNSNPGSKSIYDPCPVGWRVPPGYAFAKASLSNGGTLNKGFSFSILTSGSSWFPATGRRLTSVDGELTGVGDSGWYWTSSVTLFYTDGSGNRFTLSQWFVDSGYVDYTLGDIGRGSGYACRCVKE